MSIVRGPSNLFPTASDLSDTCHLCGKRLVFPHYWHGARTLQLHIECAENMAFWLLQDTRRPTAKVAPEPMPDIEEVIRLADEQFAKEQSELSELFSRENGLTEEELREAIKAKFESKLSEFMSDPVCPLPRTGKVNDLLEKLREMVTLLEPHKGKVFKVSPFSRDKTPALLKHIRDNT